MRQGKLAGEPFERRLLKFRYGNCSQVGLVIARRMDEKNQSIAKGMEKYIVVK